MRATLVGMVVMAVVMAVVAAAADDSLLNKYRLASVEMGINLQTGNLKAARAAARKMGSMLPSVAKREGLAFSKVLEQFQDKNFIPALEERLRRLCIKPTHPRMLENLKECLKVLREAAVEAAQE